MVTDLVYFTLMIVPIIPSQSYLSKQLVLIISEADYKNFIVDHIYCKSLSTIM